MKKTNNKGFSLVELIIVIAIMAILIGVLAPQYIKYVEKSRVSADKDLLDSMYNAATTAASDPDITDIPSAGDQLGTAILGAPAGSQTWSAEVLSTLGATSFATVQGKLKSKVAKGSSVHFNIDSKGNFTVWVGSSTNTNANSVGIVVGAGAD